MSAPGGYYSGFIDKYLNFIPAFRDSLLHASKYFLELLGYESFISAPTHLRMVGGNAIYVVYSCLGYGVTSFWLAFVFANTGNWKRKLGWMIGGAAVLYMINVIRLSLFLLAVNKHWKYPLGWDHHTWFTIAAYGMIFLMMWIYDRGNRPTGSGGQPGNGQRCMGKEDEGEKEEERDVALQHFGLPRKRKDTKIFRLRRK